jgi:hypothetical protein
MSKTNLLTEQDVLNVANDLGINITKSQVQQVLERYEGEQDEDKTATWDLVIENILYTI